MRRAAAPQQPKPKKKKLRPKPTKPPLPSTKRRILKRRRIRTRSPLSIYTRRETSRARTICSKKSTTKIPIPIRREYSLRYCILMRAVSLKCAVRSRNLLKLAQKNIFGRLGFFGKLSARWISGLY